MKKLYFYLFTHYKGYPCRWEVSSYLTKLAPASQLQEAGIHYVMGRLELNEIAEKMNTTRERIRQYLNAIVRKCKNR